MVDMMMRLMCMYCKAIDSRINKRAKHTATHNSSLITHNSQLSTGQSPLNS